MPQLDLHIGIQQYIWVLLALTFFFLFIRYVYIVKVQVIEKAAKHNKIYVYTQEIQLVYLAAFIHIC